ALDGRPLVKVWREPWISLAIIVLGIFTFLTIELTAPLSKQIGWLILISCGLITASYFVFLHAYWLPLIPTLLAVWGAGIFWLLYNAYESILVLNGKLSQKLEQRQIYRELSALSNQLSFRLLPYLESVKNYPQLVNIQEQNIEQKLVTLTTNSKLKQEIQRNLSKWEILFSQYTENVEHIIALLALNLPNLENLLDQEGDYELEEYSLAQIINTIVAALRYDIFQEYHLDIWDILAINFTNDNPERLKININKLIILIHTIIDEILLTSQFDNLSFPKILIEATTESDSYKIKIEILKNYSPNPLKIFTCEDLVNYYGGELLIVKTKRTTQWIISFLKIQNKNFV
ncbi:MAG: hypothetical protein ACRDEA_14870, partial [Microcystaceae cyanobacterium]